MSPCSTAALALLYTVKSQAAQCDERCAPESLRVHNGSVAQAGSIRAVRVSPAILEKRSRYLDLTLKGYCPSVPLVNHLEVPKKRSAD